MKRQYNTSPIISGDIVECIVPYPERYTEGKLYIVKEICGKFTEVTLCDDGFTNDSWGTENFKKVKTKPGIEAKKGDKVIYTNDPTDGCKTQEIYTVQKTSNLNSNNFIYWNPDSSSHRYASEFLAVEYEEEFHYPLFFKHKNQDLIVKFTDLITGEIVKEHPQAKSKNSGGAGYTLPKSSVVKNWTPHTNTNSWIQVENPSIEKSALPINQKRNLAFYKKSRKSWTIAEAINICNYCGDTNTSFDEKYIPKKEYFYDSNSGNTAFMYAWSDQNEQRINECEILCYEDIFTSKKPYPKLIKELTDCKDNSICISKDEFIQIDTPILHGFNTLISKENKMTQDTKIEIKINGKQLKLEDNLPKVPKTALENHAKYVTIWFNTIGNIFSQTSQTAKEATKDLQKPDMLGYTFITYKKTTSRTTSIPVKDV